MRRRSRRKGPVDFFNQRAPGAQAEDIGARAGRVRQGSWPLEDTICLKLPMPYRPDNIPQLGQFPKSFIDMRFRLHFCIRCAILEISGSEYERPQTEKPAGARLFGV